MLSKLLICYYPEPVILKYTIKVELDFSNYAIKKELKNASGIDTSDLAATKDFNALIVKVDKQDINKLVHVPTGITK